MTVPRPSPTPQSEITTTTVASSEDTSEKWLVKTPWTTNELKGEGFPTATPDGVEMNKDEVSAIKKVADEMRIKLNVSKVTSKEGSN